VRLIVDTGLLAIVILSIAIRQPFTLQYAREQTPPAIWGNSEFVRSNYVITTAWAFAFAVMVTSGLALLYIPGTPRQIGVLAIIAALIGAVKFTGWYPEQARGVSQQNADHRWPVAICA
jgi:protein-S-isoprenylcysteine O-methyltransferase Ste14